MKHLQFVTLLMLISFAAVNAVMFTPALPRISDYFHITDEVAQQAVTIFLVGYALGQLLYGPIANRFGRKPAIYVGIAIQVVSSLVCALAGFIESFSLLIVARFTAALGSGVGLKMTFTMIAELYPPKEASKKTAYTSLAFSFMPGATVALGGWITTYLGWQACFYVLAVYGVILFLLCRLLPESHSGLDPHALKPQKMLKDYSEQFKNPMLWLGGVLMATCGAIIYIFAALAPFIAIDLYGLTAAEYGLANLIPLVGLTLGGIHSGRSTQRKELLHIMRFGSLSMLVGVACMFSLIWTNNVYAFLFIPAALLFFGTAHVLPNVSSLVLSKLTNKSHGSAVLNFISMSTVTGIVLLTTLVQSNQQWVIIFAYLVVMVVNMAALRGLRIRTNHLS